MQHQTHLQDQELILRPMTSDDIAPLLALAEAGAEEFNQMGTWPNTEKFYKMGLEAADQQPFIIEAGGEYAGSTRFMEIRPKQHRLEIGATFLLPQFMRTGINRRAKLLLLTYAFEDLGMLRVELKTDILNERSQRAIEGIGATKEGILRMHMPRLDGSQRDTVMYSVIAAEWPEVKARLAQGRV